MSEYVLGKNVTVFWNTDLGSGAQYYRLFCAKSMELDIVQDEIESTTITSGTDREYEIGLQSAVLTLVGVTKTKNPPDVDAIGPFTLYAQRKTKLALQIIFTDQTGDFAQFTCDAILRRLNFASNVLSFNQSTAEFRISGPIVPYGGGGSCDPVGFDAFEFPDAVADEAYVFTIPLTGDAPFSRAAGLPTKPSWMIIDSSGANISGTPDSGDIGGPFTISYNIENCDGDNTISISKTINVLEAGRPVFVINDSDQTVVLQNANGTNYTFLPNNGSDRNMSLQDANVIVVSGSPTTETDLQFYTSYPSTTISDDYPTTDSNTYASDDFSLTNYIHLHND